MMFAGQVTALATAHGTGVMPDPDAPVPVPATLVTTPLFHVTANNCGAYATTAAGGKMVLMYRWDAGEALKLIEREKISSVSGVPVMARELVTHPDFGKYDTSSLMSRRRRRRADPARPGREDREHRGHGPAEHRLRHDRDLRHHHLDQRRLLRRQAGQLRPRHAELRNQGASTTTGKRPAARRSRASSGCAARR
jgi:hypothetical protein